MNPSHKRCVEQVHSPRRKAIAAFPWRIGDVHSSAGKCEVWHHTSVLIVISSYCKYDPATGEECRECLPQVTKRFGDLIDASRHLGLFREKIPSDDEDIDSLAFADPRNLL